MKNHRGSHGAYEIQILELFLRVLDLQDLVSPDGNFSSGSGTDINKGSSEIRRGKDEEEVGKFRLFASTFLYKIL